MHCQNKSCIPLRTLSKDKSIQICEFDKWNGTVIMNTNDYCDKLNTIVLDESKFKEVQVDENDTHPVIKKQNSIKYYLNTYVKDHVDKETLDSITPVGAQPGKL